MSEVVRAFELPLQSVEWDLAAGKPPKDADGWKVIRECWEQALCLSNWAINELRKADTVRLPGTTKLPKMPEMDLYALAFGRTKPRKNKKGDRMLPKVKPQYDGGSFWRGAMISAATVLNNVRSDYVGDRLDVLWFRRKTFKEYRSVPWPVHNQAWKEAGLDQACKPWVRVSLPGGPVILRLRSGPEFARQMAMFKEVVKGDLPRLQLVIREERRNGDNHRPGTEGRGAGSRVMVKMVAKLPAKDKPGDRCLVLATDPHSFWVAEIDGRRAWVLNADHHRRLVEGHQRHLAVLQRLGQDAKAERRMGSNRAKGIAERVEAQCLKHQNRMASLTHEAAAHLVGFARRNGVGEVFYLDRDKGFCPKFPWYELMRKLADKCAEEGVAFYAESQGKQVQSGGVLEEDGQTELRGQNATEVNVQPRKDDDKWLRITKLRETATKKLLATRRRSGSHPEVSVP